MATKSVRHEILAYIAGEAGFEPALTMYSTPAFAKSIESFTH